MGNLASLMRTSRDRALLVRQGQFHDHLKIQDCFQRFYQNNIITNGFQINLLFNQNDQRQAMANEFPICLENISYDEDQKLNQYVEFLNLPICIMPHLQTSILSIIQISLMNSSASTVSGKFKLKIVLLGNQSVGKSCIIERYVKDKFDQTSNSTVGIDFLAKNITYKNKNYRLQIWDTAGQERFRSLIPGYLREAQCALIVFDVCSKSSLNNVEAWLHLYNENKTGEGFTILIGNKIDLNDEREVNDNEGKTKAKELGLLYYEVSAKTGENIEELFSNIVQICTEKSLDGSNFSYKSTKKDSHTIQEVQDQQKEQKHSKIENNSKNNRIILKKDKQENVAKKEQKCC